MEIISRFFLIFVFVGCASRVLKYEKTDELKNIKEFEEAVKIETVDTPVTSALALPPPAEIRTPPVVEKKKKTRTSAVKLTKPSRREPPIENDEGFSGGRRPVVDPFRIGEKIVHKVSYFGVSAGELVLENRPFANVNDKKSYHFRISIKSSPLFSRIYSVDDYVDTMLDFEQLIPSVFTLHVRESKKLIESRAFFDHQQNKVNIWEKKVTSESGEENIKHNWTVEPFTQNVYSAIFYMRFFQWRVGKENAFWVANDNENVIFRGKAIRREKISTDVGEYDAIVVKPEIELPGKFNPVGDIFIWLSNDDRKFVLKIESKIKIGTLVSEVMGLHPGLQ